jgi:hypothetical protein
MSKILGLLASLFALLCNPVLAQTSFTETTAKLVHIIVMPERPVPALLARAVSNYCNELLSVIPSNSPSEDAWIRKEMATTDLGKIRRAEASAEYARFFLVEMFTDCRMVTSKLIEYGSTPHRVAAIHWAQLALTFQNTEDAKIHAARLGLFRAGKAENDIYAFDLIHNMRRASNLSVITILEKLP